MPACAIAPADRRSQIQLVGNDLISNYGKKDHYTVEEVQEANKRQGIKVDISCWSHAVFNSHEDFDRYHRTLGESCDYVAMKKEMLDAVGSGADASWFDFDLSWLEFPSLDLSIFDL